VFLLSSTNPWNVREVRGNKKGAPLVDNGGAFAGLLSNTATYSLVMFYFCISAFARHNAFGMPKAK